MLHKVGHKLGASEYDFPEPIDSHILRGVCLMLPIMHSRDDVQVRIRTRNGVCALATWLAQLLGFEVEVTQKNQILQPSIVRLGPCSTRTDIKIDVKIDAVSEENPCVMLIGLEILTECDKPALLAEVGDVSIGRDQMLRIRRDYRDYRIDQHRNVFEYEDLKTFLRVYPNFWLDKEVHGVSRRPVRGLGRKVLECAATNFAGAAGYPDRRAWIKKLTCVTMRFALDAAAHLRKCSIEVLPEESITTNDGFNDNEDLALGSRMHFSRHLVLQVGRLLFNQRLGEASVEELHPEISSLSVVRDLAVLVLTFANVIDLNSCDELPLDCEFGLLDDQALVRRIRTWNGSSPIRVQENDWFEIIAKLLVSRTGIVNIESLNSASLLSDHGWSICRPQVDLRRDPSDMGKSLPAIA